MTPPRPRSKTAARARKVSAESSPTPGQSAGSGAGSGLPALRALADLAYGGSLADLAHDLARRAAGHVRGLTHRHRAHAADDLAALKGCTHDRDA